MTKAWDEVERIKCGIDVMIYGSTRVDIYDDHVRIPLRDWNDIKQRLIPVLKQGDMKHGSTETGDKEKAGGGHSGISANPIY